ncbi:hypothetical protein M426DRAFT_320435, partial [Hypoxylon sp. CI-4A]
MRVSCYWLLHYKSDFTSRVQANRYRQHNALYPWYLTQATLGIWVVSLPSFLTHGT